MQSLRLNSFFGSVGMLMEEFVFVRTDLSSFLGTVSIRLAQSLMLLKIIPACSNCFTFWSMNSPYLSGAD